MTAAVSQPLAAGLRLSLAPLDYASLIIYFVFVIGIGFALRRLVQTSTDFFLSGRSLPTWITGIAFISANLGAIEILSMAANGSRVRHQHRALLLDRRGALPWCSSAW